ncbi:hypothetical protein E4T42_03213 [Aureobasidium subglaciale]|nr:hypothetical protein E4T42_03213 [Aureobasidium subglaciale]
MPPAFIQDSEDEDDLVTVAAPAAVATLTRCGEEVPNDIDDQSSASTAELLRRAQVALMAPTQEDVPVVNFSDLAATSVATSPASSHKKRPVSDTDPEPRSSGKLKRIKIVTKPESRYSSTDLLLSAPVPPFDGTNDTIPGPTLPSAAGHHVVHEKRTPKPRNRNSSQHSSADQTNNLTPWSGTVLGSSDRLNSDDAIGYPKELYNPKPSRSRSAQVDTSHIDYTMVVEKAVKKGKPKRSATDTSDHVTPSSIFPALPIDQAPPFERLSPSPEAPVSTDSLQLHSTVPESVQDLYLSTKSARKATNTKLPAKRGRPKKKVVADDEEDEEDEPAHGEDVPAARSTPRSVIKTEVQVVIEPRSDPALAASVLAQLRQHKSREPTPKPDEEPAFQEAMSAPSREIDHVGFKAESELGVGNESAEEVVKPRANARSKAKAKPKAKSKTPEPVYKDEDDYEHQDEDEFVEEPVKAKAKSKAKPKAKPKAKGRVAKAIATPDPPSDHDEDMPKVPLPDGDEDDSEDDHLSEAEEDSESESPKAKPKAKAKAEPKSKTKPKPKAAAPKPTAATPKPSPPIPEAEIPAPAIMEVSTPAAVTTPKVATVKKDAKSSAKPSWQQSTYRVGLSKTQRIPSLLKVFKK